MSKTTAHLGLSPIIRLHGVGLLVGSIVANSRKAGLSTGMALKQAVESGYGLTMESREL